VPIGETLAEARHEAGLTVAQVSERTRIRETIIRGIEHDDYAACGGDFYARGNIRSIAKVVGADAEPLIHEYDTARRAPGALSAVSLDELLATSAQAPRRRANLSAVRGAAASVHASARSKVNLPAVRGAAASVHASARSKVNLPAVRERVVRAGLSPGRRPNWAAVLAVALALVLALVLGFVAYRWLAGSPPPGQPPAAGKQAATQQHARQGGPSQAPAASHAAAATSPAPVAPTRTLIPVSVTAFGPGGGDNPQRAHLAIDGDRGSGWHSDWYTSARFGNLYSGTGLLLNMGRAVTITRVQVNLGRVSGAAFQVRVGTRPAMARLRPVARAGNAGGVVRLRLGRPAHGRYVLLWFTRLPADSAGTFQAGVYNVRLAGHA
jgi:transcriptional regulator with XRE-family HTH domain